MQTRPRLRDPALRQLPGPGLVSVRPRWPGRWPARPAGPGCRGRILPSTAPASSKRLPRAVQRLPRMNPGVLMRAAGNCGLSR